MYIITSGSGLIDDGTGEARVSPGDAILTGNGETHTLRNDGNQALKLIAMIVLYGEDE